MYKLIGLVLGIFVLVDVAIVYQYHDHGRPGNLIFEQENSEVKFRDVKAPFTASDWVISSLFLGAQVALSVALYSGHVRRKP